jgi:hypothetical protein
MQPLLSRVAGHTGQRSRVPVISATWSIPGGPHPFYAVLEGPVFILDIVMQDEAVANKGSGLRATGAMTSDFGGGLGRIRRCRPSQPLSLEAVNGQKTLPGPAL